MEREEEALLAGKAPLRRLRPSKGGFRTIPFILVNQALEKLSYYGILPNMILYLTAEYGMATAEAAKVLFLWSAATNFFPLISAFIADSYFGRFVVVGLGSSISLLGMVLLWSTTIFPQARPQCDISTQSCTSSTPDQLFLLYSAFTLTAIGAGGVRSSCLAFSADQLKPASDGDDIATSALESLFNWFYISVMVATFMSQTFMVYIQTRFGWEVGFGVPVALMALSVVVFFAASPFYVKVKSDSSLVPGLAQVLVAAFRNRRIDLSSEDRVSYRHEKGSSLFIPSEKLRFLNKACASSTAEENLTLTGATRDPWRLCTVQQVEDLKSLMRVLPIWSTGIVFSVTNLQGSFIVLEAKRMDRTTIVPGFEIPAASFGVFMIMSFVAFLVLYERILVPLASSIRGEPLRMGFMKRMGTGHALSVLSMAALALMENFRRKSAHCPEKTAGKCTEMSASWLLPFMVISGVAEAMNAIAQNEFYYMELPKTMSSVATTLVGLGMAAGSLASSWIVSSVDSITGAGGRSWVSGDIDDGHLDYYYWLISALCVFNFFYFLLCSKAYGKCKGEEDEREGDGLGMSQ